MNANLYDQLKNKPYYIPLTIKGEILRRDADGKDIVKSETINNYEVIKRIGEGAFSKVYEARYVG
jgi:serine/threonine protein kinase